jgi:hypothetical protein
MGLDLAVDQFEPSLRIGDLLAEARRKLSEQIAVFPSGSLGVKMQLSDLPDKHRVTLGIQGSDVALGVPDLPCNAKKLRRRSFTRNESVNLAVIVKQTLQRFGVAPAVRLISTSHQQREVPLLGIVAREVGVDALSNVAEQRLEAGRRVKLFGFAGIPKCSVVRLLRLTASLLGPAACGVGIVEIDLALSDARLQIVKLRVKNTDLAKVTSFEGLELGTKLGKFRFTFSKQRANGSKLLALVEKGNVVRALLENDFGWHAAST